MVAIQRTTRDAAGLIFPVLILFTAALTYISFAAHGFAPVVGTIYSDASWLAPPIAVLLWILLIRYTYRLLFPVTFLTEVFHDRIVFTDSSKPNVPIVLLRSDIVRFYIKPRPRWATENGPYPVLYDTKQEQTKKISFNFVYDDTAQNFFRAIRNTWGEGYVPDTMPLK